MPAGPNGDALLFSYRLGTKWPHFSHGFFAGMVLVELYLYRLRPIILKKDRTNFDKVCRILSRKFTFPAIAKGISEERKLYRGANIENTLKISSNVDGAQVSVGGGLA